MASILVFASPEEQESLNLPRALGEPVIFRLRNGNLPVSQGIEQAESVLITSGASHAEEIQKAYEDAGVPVQANLAPEKVLDVACVETKKAVDESIKKVELKHRAAKKQDKHDK